jgi:hypothetical protein
VSVRGKRSGMRMKKRREYGLGRMSLGGCGGGLLHGCLSRSLNRVSTRRCVAAGSILQRAVCGTTSTDGTSTTYSAAQRKPGPTITGACMTHIRQPIRSSYSNSSSLLLSSPLHLATPIFKQPPTTSTASQSTGLGAASPSDGASPSVAPSLRSACCLCLMAMYVRVLRKCYDDHQ